MAEDWVLLQLSMQIQLGILRKLFTKKENIVTELKNGDKLSMLTFTLQPLLFHGILLDSIEI